MTVDDVARLRAEAARDDYASMARLARALYETGLGPREVVRTCYGVEFPEEFFVVSEKGPWALDLLPRFTSQPWGLAVPLSRGGPPMVRESTKEIESTLLDRDPDLLPLMRVPRPEDLIVCYRISELGAGRPTTFGIGRRAAPSDEITRCGDSMLTVVHDEHAEAVRLLESERRQPSNWGIGSVRAEEIDDARSSLDLVEKLQRETASRLRG